MSRKAGVILIFLCALLAVVGWALMAYAGNVGIPMLVDSEETDAAAYASMTLALAYGTTVTTIGVVCAAGLAVGMYRKAA